MRIGIDLRMIGGGAGLDRYITELTHEILRQDKTNDYVLFFRNADSAEKYLSYGQKVVIADIAHYSFAEQFKLPGILKKEKLDLMHFPHFNVPLFYRRPFVVTIHDLTHTLIPGKKMSRFFHRLAYRLVFWNAVWSSVKIIAVSNATKKAILEFYQDFLPKSDPPLAENHHKYNDKIVVVYEGFNALYGMMDKELAYAQVSNRFGITKPYILYVGAWRRYKNLPMLALAFDKLVDQGLDIEWVLAGEPDPFYPEIKLSVLNIKHSNRIKALGRVSDPDLKLLYNGARLFVLPSLMEGFGLPVLEAAVCGVPIACSDILALREIAGGAAEFFDPDNLENMTDVLSALLRDENRLEELANLALSRVKYFSWKKAAEETIKVYYMSLRGAN